MSSQSNWFSVHDEAPHQPPEGELTVGIEAPPLTGSWVQLRPLIPEDYRWLYMLASEPAYGYRWRSRTGVPSFEDFVRTINQGVFQQFLVASADGKRRLGLVVCYRVDFRNRHAYIAMQSSPEAITRGWILQAGALFINYLFSSHDFEKLYAESPEFVVDSFRSGLGRDFVEEAHFKRHERYMGRWWDSYVFAMYRTRWEELVAERKLHLGTEGALTQPAEPLEFADFVTYLENQLDLEEGSLAEDTNFIEDLGFDSILMLELLSVIEDLGVFLDDEALAEIQTVADANFRYQQATKA